MYVTSYLNYPVYVEFLFPLVSNFASSNSNTAEQNILRNSTTIVAINPMFTKDFGDSFEIRVNCSDVRIWIARGYASPPYRPDGWPIDRWLLRECIVAVVLGAAIESIVAT